MAVHRTRPVDDLVGDLVRDLRPVRPLPPPGLRALAWLGAACLIGFALAALAEIPDLRERLATPDLRMAAAGALLTAVTAAYAAFATSVPGRPAAWALLPLPAAALWIGASGLGCLKAYLAPVAEAHAQTGLGCFGFLTAVSLPLSALLVLMLRRACPLRPNLTAALGGLATAAAAATLLVPFHPEEATATDIAIHGATVIAVIALNGLAGGRLLARG
ncbi:NrsF family protein [Methylobacterium dankookense]|uniref:DUF1109 domain-containing protein n=1 Tax=Methylobacterium dankookense TaxID=560405 RepID=A0A564G3Z7_9HYPH|nr:NrsF family protein [Methylobacterium dankookense]GJD55527.1 hypothetical protein IFDJLNFL_1414 [Methylobacterium dankookense]VUF14311.1 hypothetical protein MTDSW087_04030 [Methylobacterium dankookense]